ncbi:alpha/beta fold hydrolase [Actibacterium pelagium]|uniref:Esterase n=1 Tax=Actibacterium pelagium TaxID=2029103 RepID=A0A917EH64_9RHOB|nr:alpha/beta fold hydrolase [Actibacterium pelagium]GGE39261.1 esterase [Actibacterium pelagium]
MLRSIVHGTDTDRPPLLIVHGLYGSARNWGVIAKRLSDERKVIAVDMRNHGESPWQKTHKYHELAADLAEVIAANGGRVDVLGHSMGGKAAMQLALTHQDMVNKLVVADIAPVAYTHSQIKYIEAMKALDLGQVEKRSDADAQLKAYVPEDGIRAFLLQSLDVKQKKWRLNLDVLAQEMSTITGWPGTQGVFEGPTFFLSGATSDYVKREDRATIKALFPNSVFSKIPGAGHWLHAEKPREFEAALRVFLNV